MTEEIFDYAKKQGWNILFICVILWQNSRLDKVEEKLYNCWEAKSYIERGLGQHQIVKHSKLIAIIPNDIYTKNHIQRYVKA